LQRLKFHEADRVSRLSRQRAKTQLAELFAPFTSQVVWMRSESAEMTSTDQFLPRVSITFMNEVRGSAKPREPMPEVERGSRARVASARRPIFRPVARSPAHTRAGVISYPAGQKFGEQLEVLPAIKRSNDRHRQWATQKITKLFAGENRTPRRAARLTYNQGRTRCAQFRRRAGRKRCTKPFRSPRLAILRNRAATELGFIQFKSSPAEAVEGARCGVVCTEWPEFRALDWPAL